MIGQEERQWNQEHDLAAEREIANLLQQKETLLQEMQHRIGNSLQIIASILLLKARTVQSEETRLHLEKAHTRVMSIAAVQQHLCASDRGEQIAASLIERLHLVVERRLRGRFRAGLRRRPADDR